MRAKRVALRIIVTCGKCQEKREVDKGAYETDLKWGNKRYCRKCSDRIRKYHI